MITTVLNPAAGRPMYLQLYGFIRSEIESGRLSSHEKLPSRRKLAAHLKVSLATVGTAYAQLAAEGYIRAEAKRGYYVQPFVAHSFSGGPQAAPAASRGSREMSGRPEFDFQTNVVDTNLFPYAIWARLARKTLSEGGGELLNAADPQGDPALRGEISRYLHDFRGINAHPGQIVVGAGSEYLLGLLIQILGRGRVYAMEDPGYPKNRRIYMGNDVEILPVQLDGQGLSASELRKTEAEIVHITPSHQFPLGMVMPVSRRISLLHWAREKAGRYVLEDDYDSEFRFVGRPIPALQGMDPEKVIYTNSFTRSLAPSLRISYLVLPPSLLEIYREKYLFYSCPVPNFEQNTLFRFMSLGYFESHLNRMRNAYKERRDQLVAAVMNSSLGGSVEVIGSDAGLHLLFRVNNGMNEKQLVSSAGAAGVRVYGAGEFSAGRAGNCPESTVVIGYSGFPAQNIAPAVERLERAWAG